LFTQCPACETTYRVSSEDLAGAHGEVECGSCGKRFDALSRLCESLPVPRFQSETQDTRPPFESDTGEVQKDDATQISDEDKRPVLPDDSDEEIDKGEAETENASSEEDFAETGGDHVDLDATGQTGDASDDEPGDELTDEAEADDSADDKTDHSRDSEEETDDISNENTEHDPAATQDIDDDSIEAIGSDLAKADNREENVEFDPSETVDLGEYDWQHTTVIQPQKPPPMAVHMEKLKNTGESQEGPEPGSIPDYLVEKDVESGVEENPVPLELTPSRSVALGGWIRWVVLGILIVILLVWIHQARGMLARHSILRPVLTGFYSVIGVDLKPARDIAQFAILSSTASENRRGDLVVSATYTNMADFPQPYPTLRVVLEDRWGEALDVHYFEPNEYLVGFVAGRAMSGGESATGEVTIPSTGTNAVGFNVDVCLNPEAADIQCTSDL
jgi:predicted Zn finger-like uncharacterized protein